MLRYAVGTTSMLLAASAAVAQAPRLREVHRVLPPRYLAAFGGEHVADINGDGLSDVVFGWSAWLRRDDDTFELRHYADFPSTGNPMDQALVDIDGDGDVDRVIANGPFVGGSGPWNDVIERNDGNGNFTSLPKIELIGSGGPSTCVAAADVNGDGAIDIVVGSEYLGPSPPPQERAFQVFINYGGGVFTLESARAPWTTAIRTNGLALVDFDADGDLDLYLANDVRLGNSDRLYENDGAGNFTTVASFGNVNDTLDVRAADFDQDGDTDLLLVDAPPGQRRLRYLENTGNGLVASAAVPPSATPFESLTLGDWNADGLLDYAVLAGCTVRAFVGDAPGSFQPALQAAVPLSNCATVGMRLFALDLEQDGDSDLIVNSASPAATQQSPDSLLLRNLGDRFEVAAGASPASIRNSIVRTGDFNNDGIEDMVVSPTFGESGQLWLGTGTDSFLAGPTSTFGSPGAIPGDMRVADVTGDGLPDVICVNNPDYFQTSLPSRIYRSTGSSLQTVGAVLPFARKLAAADFDGDGDVDLLLDTATIPDMLLANTGSGIFTAVANAIPPTSFFPNTYPTDLFAADFDGDGDLDVAGIGSQLLQNNGSGIFSMVSSGPISYPLVADFDADGDPDVFLPLLGVLPGNHTMLRNDGNWSFASVSIPATQRVPAIHHVAADFDNDGLMDLVGTTFRGSAYGYPPSTILHNLGGMAFAAVPDSVLAEPSAVADSVARLDIDGDDDVDVIVPDGRGLLVYRNLHHQLAWRSLPRVGGRVALDIYGRAGEAFVLGIAPRLAPVPIPLPGLGTLHLDPATLQASAARSIGPEGRFGYVVDLPNAPQLVGVVVFAQALYPQQIGNLETIELRAR